MTDLNPEGLEKAVEAVWESIHDKGIRGRLFRDDCDYVTRAAVTAYLDAQTVTTMEELDALPVGSVVLSSDLAWQVDEDPEVRWWTTGGDEDGYASNELVLPARVLHRGTS